MPRGLAASIQQASTQTCTTCSAWPTICFAQQCFAQPHLVQVARLRGPCRQQHNVDHRPQRQQQRGHQAQVGQEAPELVEQVTIGT